MDKKTFLAIAIAMMGFLGWQYIYKPSHSPAPQLARAGAIAGDVGKPHATLPFAIEGSTVQLNPGLRMVSGWTLDEFRGIDLDKVTKDAGQLEISVDSSTPEFSALPDAQAVWTVEKSKAVLNAQAENYSITAELLKGGKYFLDANLKIEFQKSKPKFVFLSLFGTETEDDPDAMDRNVLFFKDNTIDKRGFSSVTEAEEVSVKSRWVGVSDRYFLLSLIDKENQSDSVLLQPLGAKKRIALRFPLNEGRGNFSLRIYFGPKELNALKGADRTLDHAVDFGWLNLLAYPLLKLLKWFHSFVGNFGIAIILLTIVVRLVLFPLNIKAAKSAKEMAKIQPQMKKLQEKHKDDREALNREMIQLMRTSGHNPLAGCLPIFLQMPVFFALYRVLYEAIDLYHAPFYGWIVDLSSKDPYYVSPVILTVAMYFQQKLTPMPTMDPAQAKMMQLMPLFFGVFMITLPSGLAIYMLTNTFLGMAQQVFMNRTINADTSGRVPARTK